MLARRLGRTAALTLAVGALVAVTGCGDDEDGAEAAGAGTTTTAAPAFAKQQMPQGSNSAAELGKKTVGVVIITQASEVFPQQQAAMKAAFAKLGWEMKLADIAGDISSVPAVVDNLLQSGVDAILLQSVEPGFVGAQVAARAKAKGVPIVGQNTGVPKAESDGVLAAAVESAFTEPGKAQGEQVIEEFGKGAKVAMIVDKLAATGRAGQKGFLEGLAGSADVVAQHQLNYAKLVPDVTATTQQWLVQHPDLKAIWCPYDGACVGAGEAVQASGKDVAVLSLGGTPTVFDLIRSGLPYTTWATPYDYLNWLTTDVLVSVLAKRDTPADTTVESVKIDKANVPGSGELDGKLIYGDFEQGFAERWGVTGG
jgi:ribose transport system substrate-binding protein